LGIIPKIFYKGFTLWKFILNIGLVVVFITLIHTVFLKSMDYLFQKRIDNSLLELREANKVIKDREIKSEIIEKYLIKHKNIKEIKLIEQGEMKIKKEQKFMSFEASETINGSGYIWSAKLFTNPLIYINIVENLIDLKAETFAKMLSTISVLDERSEEILKSNQVAYFSKIPFMPNLLLSEGLEFKDLDKKRVEIRDGNFSAIIHFNDNLEITQFSSKRFKKDWDKFVEQDWVVRFSKYQDMNGLNIPTEYSFIWINEEFLYATFSIKNCEFFE